MIDTNVTLHRWPFRRLPNDEPAALVAHLRRRGVTEAWACSFDGMLSRDISAVNARIAADCRHYGGGFLVPIGAINPTLPDWQEDLRRIKERHRMPGIRLYPNYHGYDFKSAAFAELLEAAETRDLMVQIACYLEDERTQYPLLRVPPVDPSTLMAILGSHPKLRVQLLNWRTILAGSHARDLSSAGQVYFDFAALEGVGGVERLSRTVPAKRILFGSHFPFFYFESAQLKVREAGLSLAVQQAIFAGNARAFTR